MALRENINLRLGMRKNTNVKSANYNKYQATIAKRNGSLTQRGFIDHVASHVLGIPRQIVSAVITQLSQCIPELVSQGVSVKLDGIGVFYPTVASKGVSRVDNFATESDIKGVRFRFKPDSTKLDNLTSAAFMNNLTSLSVDYVWGDVVTRAPGTDSPEDPGATAKAWIEIDKWRSGL